MIGLINRQSPPQNPSSRQAGRSRKLFAIASALALLLPIFCCPAGSAHAQTDQSVYSDALDNGWQNWSWATVNLSNSRPVQSGSASISVTAGPYQALYLHHDRLRFEPL